MLIKSIEKKININRQVSIATVIFAIIIVIVGYVFAYKLINNSQKVIYVLDNGVPVLVKQTDELLNRPVEYKANVELFHRLFFTLPPDDKYIKENIEKSLYLIDDSGKKEYVNLREKGFYNQLISSSAMGSIKTDSIKINLEHKKFAFFGTQMINRKKSIVIRKLITEGNFENITRTPNNPHGVLLTNWKIIDNTELSNQEKY